MATAQLEIGGDILEILRRLGQPVSQTARELIVLELYRRELVSGGKAAELLGMSTREFIEHAAALDIPYFGASLEEIKADADTICDVISTG